MNYEKKLIITCEFMAAKVLLLLLCATTIVVELCLAQESPSVIKDTSVEVEFTKEPENSIIGIGRNVTLVCQVRINGAKKLGPTNYQWRLNNETETKFRSSGTLTVNANLTRRRRKEIDGLYYCIANTTFGMLRSRSALFKYAEISLPPAEKLPVTITAFESNSVRLTCDVISVPEPEFSWKRKNDQILEGQNEKYLISSKYLYINNVQKTDAGEYSCEARNPLAADGVTALSMILKVATSTSSRHLEFVSPEPPPYNISVPRGKNLSLHCHTNRRDADVVWTEITTKDRGTTVLFLSKSRKNYYTLDVNVSKDYQFVCVAEIPLLGMKIQTQTVNIIAGDAPKVMQISASQKVSMIGIPARLQCNVTGFPIPDVTWYHNGEKVFLNRDHRLSMKSMQLSSKEKSYSLIVQSIASADRGVYQCVAENQFGTTSKATVLEVTPDGHVPSKVTNVTCTPKSTSEILIEYNYDVDPGAPAIEFDENSNSNSLFGRNSKDEDKAESSSTISDVFVITYHVEGNVTDQQTETTMGGPVLIGKLRPNTKYVFSIRRYNGNQGSEPSNWAACMTIGGSNSKVNFERIFLDTVLLWWNKVQGETYTVEAKLNEMEVYRRDTSDSFVVLSNLTIGKEYDVKVSSKKDNFESKTFTLEAPSSSTDRVFRVYKINESSAVFMWSMNSDLDWLKGFLIRYKKYGSKDSDKETYLPPNATNYLAFNLSSADLYEVSLFLMKEDEKIEVHRTVFDMSVRTSEHQLMPPTEPECRTEGSSIIFVWFYPYEIAGPMFLVRFRKQGSNDELRMIVPRIPNTNYKFENLLPDTEYEISVRVFSKDGKNSDYANSLLCRTDPVRSKESPPSEVININFTQLDPTTISVSWEKPKIFNELEDHYVVSYSALNTTSNPTTIDIPGTSNSTSITDLHADTDYVITVRAENFETGQGTDSTKKFIKLNERKESNEALIGVIIGISIGISFIIFCVISAVYGKRFLKKYYYERNDSMRALSTFKKQDMNILAKNSTVFRNSAAYSNGGNLQAPLLNGSYVNGGVHFTSMGGATYFPGASGQPVRYERDMLLDNDSPAVGTFHTTMEITDTERDNEGGDSGYCDKTHSQSPPLRDCSTRRPRKSSDTATDEGFHDSNTVCTNGSSPV